MSSISSKLDVALQLKDVILQLQSENQMLRNQSTLQATALKAPPQVTGFCGAPDVGQKIQMPR